MYLHVMFSNNLCKPAVARLLQHMTRQECGGTPGRVWSFIPLDGNLNHMGPTATTAEEKNIL